MGAHPLCLGRGPNVVRIERYVGDDDRRHRCLNRSQTGRCQKLGPRVLPRVVNEARRGVCVSDAVPAASPPPAVCRGRTPMSGTSHRAERYRSPNQLYGRSLPRSTLNVAARESLAPYLPRCPRALREPERPWPPPGAAADADDADDDALSDLPPRPKLRESNDDDRPGLWPKLRESGLVTVAGRSRPWPSSPTPA